MLSANEARSLAYVVSFPFKISLAKTRIKIMKIMASGG